MIHTDSAFAQAKLFGDFGVAFSAVPQNRDPLFLLDRHSEGLLEPGDKGHFVPGEKGQF